MYKVSIVLFAIMIFVVNKTIAQDTRQRRDTVRIQQMQQLKKTLDLTEEQFNSFSIADEIYKNSIDSLNAVHSNIEDRKNGLQKIVTTYYQSLQKVFTFTQWQQYQAKQKAIQQSFEEHAKQQKIKYTLLNNQ
ncbi:MAG TPA: hypothetical protein PK772_08165 [Chitinophagaceae bacterium]|nr:hypothetical protein [Chitinophagaceae bacterium]